MSSYSTDSKTIYGAEAASTSYATDAAAPALTGASKTRSRYTRRLWFVVSALGSLGALHLYGLRNGAPTPRVGNGCAAPNDNPEFVWDQITPSKNLSWVPCYDDKLCARLTVPLDYFDPSGPVGAIAMVKVAAKVPPTDERYRGPVLFNPGGPGGSGVDMVRRAGALFATILGDEYDLIGFDPRGVGRTIPKIVVFPDANEAAAWQIQAAPPFNATPDATARAWAQSAVFGSLGQQRVAEEGKYVSTSLVSRDMLHISKLHGYDKLQYWGFSYGTVLGATFATMFPDNVGRVIIDGVEDLEDYYSTGWSNNLRDTDKTIGWFTDACAAAGPEACALHDSSSAKVAARIDDIFATLKKEPIAVPLPKNHSSATTSSDYGIVDYRLVRQMFFNYLYSPNNGANNSTAIARILASVEKGDGRPAWDASKAGQPTLKCECPGTPKPPAMGSAMVAIACSDGDPVEDSPEDLEKHYERMAKDSSLADMWFPRSACSGWKIRAKERFVGPWVANTSFPLLLIGNTADPVTPLWNAHKVSKGFKDAVVLTQNSPGHCSLAAASLCTAKAIRAYFRDGVLPEKGSVCEIDKGLFGDIRKDFGAMSLEEETFLDAITKLSESVEVARAPRY